jgi:hypothetical protein
VAGDEGRGYDRAGAPRVLRARSVDQGDLPGAPGLAQHGAKILGSGETAFVYERKVQPQPKIGPWREELDRLLAVNAARASRERLTLIRIFEALRGLGYEGGYDAVQR